MLVTSQIMSSVLACFADFTGEISHTNFKPI